MPPALMVAISIAMVGCGGGGSGGSSNSSNNNGTDSSNNGNNTPKPVTCTVDQYLENNVCLNKAEQTIKPLKIKYILTDSVYSLDTKSSAELPITISSLSTATCTYSNGELKGIGAGACTLKFTQEGHDKTLAAESKTISFDVFNTSSMSAAADINNCYAQAS